MKKEMSSFDVRSVAIEMQTLKDAHMDKIFQWGNNVLFRLNVSGTGKKDLFFQEKKWLYMPEIRPETPIVPQSFATFLRKYIDNARIGEIKQLGFDRVVVMDVLKADCDYQMVFEMFGGGNVLLVLDGKIVNCLVQKTMRDRSVRPGEPYIPPKARFDPTSSPEEEFGQIMHASEADTVRTLATGINLGGQYAEEVCKRSGIDKSRKAKDLSDAENAVLFGKMREVVDSVLNDPSAIMYRDDKGEVAEISPVEMSVYSDCTAEKYDSISKAIEALIRETAETAAEEYIDPETEKLQRRIEKQTETVEEYREAADELRRKADVLYSEYKMTDDLLNVLGEQSKKLTWEKLKAGAMKIPYVVSIDPSKNAVIAKLGGLDVPLDYTKGLDANASILYGQGKELNDKADRANDALKGSQEELDKRMAGLAKEKAKNAGKVQPTKQYWFDRYKWFVAPSGRLCIAGKDAHTNDNVVKKHLKEEDIYAHADLHGAPSVILKDGKIAPPEDLRETCIFALAQSKGWVAAMGDGSAYWVFTDQVSKTPQAGEFVPRGAFIIRGKRNYEYHLPLELAVGEIEYEGNRKVMCSPLMSMEKLSKKYFVIAPGRGKAGKTAATMAKELNVPEEEVSRILPPGDAQITRKVWPDEKSEEQNMN
jgi:predicted ribosome quality control (RQC) complex YloA/Tae2 family protein